jgi:Rieske Fe-S protein
MQMRDDKTEEPTTLVPLSSRRDFMRGAAACAAVCAAGTLPGCGPDLGVVDAGNVSELPEGTLRAVAEGTPVAIGRDAGGVYAMTLICTHFQCDISTDGTVDVDGITCGCHGSAFDGDGGVTNGPATAPLDHLAVTIGDDGAISVDTAQVVEASTRVSVSA